jgi:hypothetical protein
MAKDLNDSDHDEQDQFSQDERITANLRLRSISPGGRFFLGMFAFVPPVWRGPIVLALFGLLAFFGPQIIDYALNKIQHVQEPSTGSAVKP